MRRGCQNFQDPSLQLSPQERERITQVKQPCTVTNHLSTRHDSFHIYVSRWRNIHEAADSMMTAITASGHSSGISSPSPAPSR
jgi:hypothetical protein